MKLGNNFNKNSFEFINEKIENLEKEKGSNYKYNYCIKYVNYNVLKQVCLVNFYSKYNGFIDVQIRYDNVLNAQVNFMFNDINIGVNKNMIIRLNLRQNNSLKIELCGEIKDFSLVVLSYEELNILSRACNNLCINSSVYDINYVNDDNIYGYNNINNYFNNIGNVLTGYNNILDINYILDNNMVSVVLGYFVLEYTDNILSLHKIINGNSSEIVVCNQIILDAKIISTNDENYCKIYYIVDGVIYCRIYDRNLILVSSTEVNTSGDLAKIFVPISPIINERYNNNLIAYFNKNHELILYNETYNINLGKGYKANIFAGNNIYVFLNNAYKIIAYNLTYTNINNRLTKQNSKSIINVDDVKYINDNFYVISNFKGTIIDMD